MGASVRRCSHNYSVSRVCYLFSATLFWSNLVNYRYRLLFRRIAVYLMELCLRLYKRPSFSFYCGDKQTSFDPVHTDRDLLNEPNMSFIKRAMQLNHTILLKQVHGATGFIIRAIDDVYHMKSQAHEGDYLITSLTKVGLAVASADCLPIIFYDQLHNTIALAHAGWKGTIVAIASKTVQAMHSYSGTQPDQVEVFFGPSAKVCCYQVQQDVISHIQHIPYSPETIQTRAGVLYCDLPLFNQLQLEQLGVPRSSINFVYNVCTMCTPAFCSSRRDKHEGAGTQRNITIVALK
jgi:YfiH family protein